MIKEQFKFQAKQFVSDWVQKGLLDHGMRLFDTRKWYHDNKDSLNFKMDNGCYKFAFIIPDFDYVIKTDSIDEWVSKNTGTYRDYGGCLNEFETYQRACKDNMERFFPETDFLIDIDGYRFYIQERAVIDADTVIKSIAYNVQENFDTREDAEYYAEDEPAEWDVLYAVLDDVEETNILANYLEDIDVNDIHNNNVGWIGERGVVIDFAC